MKIADTKIAGVHVVETKPFTDDRGSFYRAYCARELKPVLGDRQIVQINHATTTKPGAIRGMHFQQAPHAEMKLVRCLRGRIWDVALDLRRGSPTFLQWHAEELTPGNKKMMIIPEGCAHGLQAQEPDSEVLYLHTAYYEPKAEGGVNYADPMIRINWPLPPADLSARDAGHPLLDKNFKGLPIS